MTRRPPGIGWPGSTLFELGALLGDAVSKIIKLYNPRTLVIGGPVARLGDHLREPMWIKVRQKVIPEMLVDLSVEIAPSQPRDEAIGAACLAERRFWKEARRAQPVRELTLAVTVLSATFSRPRSASPPIPTGCRGTGHPPGAG